MVGFFSPTTILSKSNGRKNPYRIDTCNPIVFSWDD
jgi:hypothetical protein